MAAQDALQSVRQVEPLRGVWTDIFHALLGNLLYRRRSMVPFEGHTGAYRAVWYGPPPRAHKGTDPKQRSVVLRY